MGDRAGEGDAYGNLGNAYHRLGDFQQAIEYHNQHLRIAKQLRNIDLSIGNWLKDWETEQEKAMLMGD